MAAGTLAMVGGVGSVAAVEANGVITGTVTDGTNPVAGALVTASPLNGLSGPGAGGNTIAAANGTYVLSGLLPGQYAVGFDGPVGSPFIGEFWQNKYFEQANPVTVTEGATTPGIDAALDLGGSISGRATGPGGVPLRDVLVSVALDPPNPGIGFSGSNRTDDNGRFTIGELRPAAYVVDFSFRNLTSVADSRYEPEVYNNTPNYANATKVAVTAGQDSSGIDAELAIRVPSGPQNVTVVSGDDQVVVSWAVPQLTGSGGAVTGYTATASPGGKTCSTTGALSCTIAGLTNGDPYTVVVTAANAAGTGFPSATVGPVTPYGSFIALKPGRVLDTRT